jgi:hypothetical protein
VCREIDIAARLTAATDSEVRRIELGHSGIRLEVTVPDDLSGPRRSALLQALGDADHYGHDLTADGGRVWAEIDRTVTPPRI